MYVIETDRLRLRQLTPTDASFILELVNDPDWLRFIGDRNVRTLDDAREYILRGPVDMYARLGFGLYLVEMRDPVVSVGICGLIKRDSLESVDLGFAFLPQFRGRGYALEAAAATMEFGRQHLLLRQIVAITDPENRSSIRLLQRLGMSFQGSIVLPHQPEEVALFALR